MKTTLTTESTESTRGRPARFSLCFLCALGVLSGESLADPNTPGRAAHAAPRFILLSGAPSPKPPVAISLIRITPDAPSRPAQMVYLDPAGVQKTMPLRDAIALAPAAWIPTPETTGASPEGKTSDLPVHRLDLTDSQRFVGMLVDAEDVSPARAAGKPEPAKATKSAEAPVLFHHEHLGVLSFPLERIAEYRSDARNPDLGGRALSISNDTILLLNTDRLEGLVTRMGSTIWIETRPLPGAGSGGAGAGAKASEQATQIDADQAKLVHLVNPAVALRTLRIDLTDGSVIAVNALSADTQGGKLIFKPIDAPSGAEASVLELGLLAGVVPNPSRITPLSTIPIASQAAASDNASSALAQVLADPRAPLSAADILLPGPMSVEWALPAGTGAPVSIVGYAQMDDVSFAWGDCVAVVSIAPKSGPERELTRARINADSPTLTIAADLGPLSPGDRLRVRTESGEGGPIQDRIVLRRMVLLGK